MENDVVPICFCADDKFIPYTAAAIQSIMENANPDTVYKLYILFSDISEKRMNLLREQVSAYKNFSLDFIDVKIYIDKYDLNSAYTNIMYGRKEIYFRLFIPYIFSNYSKIIYLDSDIICLADIAKIISGNSGCIVEVVRDCGAVRGSKKYASGLGLKKPENYFNSGVIVFNTSLFKQNISEEKLFSYINKPYDFPDQDILNIVCEGNVDFLELSWNVMGVDMNKRITTKFKNEYNISQKNPYIIHYGGDKPWKNFIITRRTKYFWEFARRTKFADIIYLGLKDIDIAELSHHDDVYAGIYEGQRYGLRFVVKCGLLWLAMKLNALKTRIGRAPERINPPPPPCEFYRPFKRCEQKYKQTSLSYVKVKNKYSSNGQPVYKAPCAVSFLMPIFRNRRGIFRTACRTHPLPAAILVCGARSSGAVKRGSETMPAFFLKQIGA